jgi:hypothetical protein
VHDAYIGSFVDSFSTVFLIAAAIVAVAFVLTWMLEERPLRKTIEESGLDNTFAAPQETDSLDEIQRQLSRAVGRERTRRFIQTVIDEAQVEATPAEAWLLGRVRAGRLPPDAVDAGSSEDREGLAAGLARLRERGMLDGGDGFGLTESGASLRGRLHEARCRRLSSLVADWQPESPEVDAMIEQLAEELERTG